MRFKIKHITLTLFLIDAFLLIININYQDQTASIIPDLDYAKFFFYLGTLSFVTYFKLVKSKELLRISSIIAISTLCISIFFNLRLAKENYNGIQYYNRISEYHELETCEEMENRFRTDLKNNKIVYFSFGLVSDEEFTEKMKSQFGIENFNLGCTVYSEKICYNKLVEQHIEKKYGKSINGLLK
tara:strand:- start:3020 stop:3574 length:555 start_codon:yes stop_codon:yes gene_type:complete